MSKHRLPLLALVAIIAGCGGGTNTPPPVTEPPTTTVAASMPLTVFRVEQGALRASSVQVPRTQAVAGAALTALGIDAQVTIDGERRASS